MHTNLNMNNFLLPFCWKKIQLQNQIVTFLLYFYLYVEDSHSKLTADRLAQLVERRTTVQEVEGSSPRPDQWLDILVFSDKDEKS